MLQKFFLYIDNGELDWVFWVTIIVILIIEVAKWVKRKLECPVCGMPQGLFVDINDNNHWFCSQCGWSAGKM